MVTYQSAKASTGKTIQMDVYDETQSIASGQSGTMVEILNTGRYCKSFTPAAEGEWIIMMYSNDWNKPQKGRKYNNQ